MASGVGRDFNEAIDKAGTVDFGGGIDLILIRRLVLDSRSVGGAEETRLDGAIDLVALAMRRIGQSNLVDGM